MTLEELGLAKQTVIAAFSIMFGASMLGWRLRSDWAGKTWLAILEEMSEDPKKRSTRNRNRCESHLPRRLPSPSGSPQIFPCRAVRSTSSKCRRPPRADAARKPT